MCLDLKIKSELTNLFYIQNDSNIYNAPKGEAVPAPLMTLIVLIMLKL